MKNLFFCITLLGFTPYWNYKPINALHADSIGVYTSKILNLSTLDKIHLKCDCFKGSIINGIQQPILYSFVLDKPQGLKYFVSLKQFNIRN